MEATSHSTCVRLQPHGLLRTIKADMALAGPASHRSFAQFAIRDDAGPHPYAAGVSSWLPSLVGGISHAGISACCQLAGRRRTAFVRQTLDPE
jgi:hypothetical protein